MPFPASVGRSEGEDDLRRLLVLRGLVDAKDPWHDRAVKLAGQGPGEMVVSDPVLAESVTIVSSRAGGEAGATLYRYSCDSCTINFVNPGLLDEAMEVHLQRNEKLALADCVSLTVMAHRGVSKILSFDSDFDLVKGLERLS
jgi:predicted nucleic acid-binding protein